MRSRLNYSGLVVAGLGFFLTRFTVTLALYENPVRFYLAGVVPLAIGLGLATFGVALTVGDFRPEVVRTTAMWSVIGFLAMLVLVVLTLIGSTDAAVDLESARSQTYLSNFLIGGSVGGTLTGLYASRNRRQRSELRQQTNRLVTLNRLLRHEVLNAVTAIRGYASLDPERNPERQSVIDDQARDIEETIEEVKYLTEKSSGAGESRTPRDIGESLEQSIQTISAQYPETDVSVEWSSEDLSAYANERLPLVFTQLLENAVEVDATPTTVTVSVRDEGGGLPENQQSLLETGDIEEFDNPNVGFGLNIVRLLVENYGGDIETVVSGSGTTVTVGLPRVPTGEINEGPTTADLTGVAPAVPHLLVTFVSAIIAGIPYAIASELLGGSVSGIGIFYGTVDPVIGWLTHEFHSIVFAFMYVGVLSLTLERYRDTVRIYEITGVLWGLVVWVVAASFIAPVWLRLLGIPAGVPDFSGRLLVSHLVWGLSLGALTSFGYRYVTPRLTGRGAGVRSP